MSDGPNLSWLYAVAMQALGVLTLVYLVALLGVGAWNPRRSSRTVPPGPGTTGTGVPSARRATTPR